GAARRDGVGRVRAGQRPALRALRDPLGLRAVGGVRVVEEPEGDRAEHGVDSDGLTFACATTAEERVARKAGLRAVRVGIRAADGIPEGRLVSFGVAGALQDGLAIGDIGDATRVVDASGATLWEGGPLGVRGARTGTVLASSDLVHDADERRRLCRSSGADA